MGKERDLLRLNVLLQQTAILGAAYSELLKTEATSLLYDGSRTESCILLCMHMVEHKVVTTKLYFCLLEKVLQL